MLEDGFYEVRGTDYIKFQARFISRNVVSKVPISPDKLVFTVLKDPGIEDLAEIIYVIDGAHVFHGDVVKKSESGALWKCEAWSVEWRLAWRFIPYYIFAAGSTMAEFFSDSGTPFASGSVPSFGLWAFIQGIIPPGSFEKYSSTVVKLPGGGINSDLHGKALRATNNYPSYAADETGAAVLTVASSLAGIGENQYWETETDLYIKFGDGSYGANAFLALAVNWLECKIRSAVTDTRTSTKDMVLQGEAKRQLDSFIEGLGMEPELRPHNSGYVLFSLADEISRGSTSNPLRTFYDGVNCRVRNPEKTDPDIQAAVGMLENGATVAGVAWDHREIQFIDVLESKGQSKVELESRLAALMADNQPQVEIEFPGYDFFLRIGDCIKVWDAQNGIRNLRIADVDNNDNKTILQVGRKPFSISAAFGELTRPEVDPDLDLISSTTISGGTFATQTGSFEVKSTDYAAAGKAWQCIYKEALKQASDGTAVSTGAFLEILVNGIKIGPGRIKISETTIEIDITDYCTVSAVSNQTNTISRTIYNYTGWSAGEDGIVVEQFKGNAFI